MYAGIASNLLKLDITMALYVSTTVDALNNNTIYAIYATKTVQLTMEGVAYILLLC